MIEETLAKIEAAIQRIGAADIDKKADLLRLLGALKKEVEALARTHAEQARSIAGFTEVAAHEASRREKAPELHQLSLDGLASSVKGFEASHPALVEAMDELCRLLASIGI